MDKEEIRQTLSAEEHAVLFALIVRNSLNIIGKESIATIEEGVIKYGEQRGNRMAQRAIKDGQDTNVMNYLVYGEWIPLSASEMEIRFPNYEPELNMVANKCSWFDVWNKRDMLAEGKYYCRHVDAALARGFNENLYLDLVEIRTEGGSKCDFFFRDNLLSEDDFKEITRRKTILNGKAIEPWDYHIAHLFYTMKEVLVDKYNELGKEVIKQSKNDYEAEFGIIKREILEEFENTDFNMARNYQGNRNIFK